MSISIDLKMPVNGAKATISPDVHALIEAAILAPSPDNNQPWRFFEGPDYLNLYLDLTRSLRSDVNHMFDLTAIGAAIENLCIAAREQETEANIELVKNDDTGSKESIAAARITWSAGHASDPLYPYLNKRHTTRRAYSTQPIDPAILQQLAAEGERFAGVKVHWLTNRRDIWRFAWLVSQADRLRFEREEFHRELFRQLRFTAKEAESARDGLDLRALELPPLGSLVLRIIRNWKLLAFANLFGGSRLLALPSILSVIQSGAIGMLSVEDATPEHFIGGGRSLERLWLAAAGQGLQVHPMGSLPIFMAHLDQLNGRDLSKSQCGRAQTLKRSLYELAPTLNGRVLQIAFRIGYGSDGTVRSLRRNIGIVSTDLDAVNRMRRRS
jgi:hypothetical protein